MRKSRRSTPLDAASSSMSGGQVRLRPRVRRRQSGMVLIVSLLLLTVVTLLAVMMFRAFGMEEKIAGNVRDKERALSAAETAQQYAEWWLAQGNGGTGVTCNSLVTANSSQVCSNALANAAVLPWTVGAASVGVTYTQPGMALTGSSSTGAYSQYPTYYISYLGLTPNGLGSVYQIDAVGYGANPITAAVVESTYAVTSSVRNLGDQ
jgi:type IV pilus assembly protein PilX